MRDAVVLMAYGSPSRIQDIRPYLEDIRQGRPVSDEAVEELTERYRRIGGRSPLDEITERQRAALRGGAECIVGLVLAPHYSALSIAGYRERLDSAVDGRAELRFVESWHDHEPFLEVLAGRVRGT